MLKKQTKHFKILRNFKIIFKGIIIKMHLRMWNILIQNTKEQTLYRNLGSDQWLKYYPHDKIK